MSSEFTFSILNEKQKEVDELTREMADQQSKLKELEMDKNILQKMLDERQRDIEQ